jgi:hypothetical protein
VNGHSYRPSSATDTSLIDRAFTPSSVRLSIVVTLTGLQGPCPFLCPANGSLLAAPPFPLSGPSEPGSPIVTGTMKALRLPTCVSAVAYFVRFRRPPDPPALCPPKRS